MNPTPLRWSPPGCSFRRWLVLSVSLVAPFLTVDGAAVATTPAPSKVDDAEESAGAGFTFSLLPKAFQKNPRLDLNVITEMTPEGKKLLLPTAAKPVYYLTIPGGYMRAGQATAAGEKAPPVEDLERVMQKALARNSYLPAADSKSAPTLALIYHWGSHNNLAEDDQALADRITEAAASGKPEAENPAVFAAGQLRYALNDLAKRKDLLDRAALIGGVKFAREFEKVIEEQVHYTNTILAKVRPPPVGNSMLDSVNAEPAPITGPIGGDSLGKLIDPTSPFERFMRSNPQVEHLVEESFSTCYFVIASAYDYADLSRGQRKLLWRTKMTVNADGVALKATLPTLVITAGKYLGREMEGAATISRRLLQGDVEVGTPTVVEFPAALPSPADSKKAGGKP